VRGKTEHNARSTRILKKKDKKVWLKRMEKIFFKSWNMRVKRECFIKEKMINYFTLLKKILRHEICSLILIVNCADSSGVGEDHITKG
jgi:hypothetical protein